MLKTEKCFLCGNEVTYGRDLYDGEWIKGDSMFVCNTCYVSNEGGWNMVYEEKILKHLKGLKIRVPARNDNNLLPLTYEHEED